MKTEVPMPKKKNSGLGRGLDAIFFENTLEKDENKENQVSKIRISLIDPKSDQPRKYFDKEALEQLADSILQNGLLQPILVREYGDGRYQIIAGERRFRASKIAGLSEIPAIILDKTDRAVAEISLIENIQREDLNPIEEAMAYKALAEEYNLTQEELSYKVGKSRSAIANTTRLLDLPDAVIELVADGSISQGHGRTLLGLKDSSNMLLLAKKVIELDLSVRQLEEEVKRANKPKRPEPVEEELPLVDYFREMELRVQSHLGRKVKIEDKGKKKTLTLYYEDNEDLDEILTALCGKDFLEQI
jgi:ParB family chromosome partitioning protein